MGRVSFWVFLLGYLTAYFDSRKQTWHDKAGRTNVVRVDAISLAMVREQAVPVPLEGDLVELRPAPVPREDAVLELRDVQAGYGPFRALFGVSLAVRKGSVLALLGSNGAGKTTVARVCSGLISPSAGYVFFDGEVVATGSEDITEQRAYQRAREGIAQAPEGRSVFASLTVDENLQLTLRRVLGRAGVASGLNRAYELFPALSRRRRQAAGTLSGGEQRMLALARVLAKPPRLLVCDELSLGLAPIVVDEVYKTLASIREAGTTLLIVEQHVGHALNIADDVAVLVKGRVTYDGSVAEMGDLSERLLPTTSTVDVPSPNGH